MSTDKGTDPPKSDLRLNLVPDDEIEDNSKPATTNNDSTSNTNNLPENTADSKNDIIETMNTTSKINKEKQVYPESEYELSLKNVFWSIVVLSTGPLFLQIANTLTEYVCSIWIGKTLGEVGNAVLGNVFCIETIPNAIGTYLVSSLSTRMSYLIGKRTTMECSQLYVDYLRISMIFGLLMIVILIPITKPFVEWFSEDKLITGQCLSHVIPMMIGSIFYFIFMSNCGLLQSTGHSFIFVLSQIGFFILDALIFTPLFLFAFKGPIWCDALGSMFSSIIMCCVLTFYAFRGKFMIFPLREMFFGEFSKETNQALRMGIATFSEFLSFSIPVMFLQKYINSIGNNIKEFNQINTVWAVISRNMAVMSAMSAAIAQGLLPAASYAFAMKKYNRVLRLALVATVITFIWSFLYEILMCAIPKIITGFWDKNPNVQEWGKKMLPVAFSCAFLICYTTVAPVLLHAINELCLAIVMSLFSLFVPIPTFSTVLYITGKYNPRRLMVTYVIHYLVALLLGSAILYRPIRKLFDNVREKQTKKPDANDTA